jgi:hypothetical protein
MRLKSLVAAVVAIVGLATLSVGSASADGVDKPRKWSKAHHTHHRVHHVRHDRGFKVDPYAWRYSPRGYYPYYGSNYWAKASYVKWRNRAHLNQWNTQPPYFRYYQSWGYPKKTWNHAKWHAVHHGRHHRWHW